MRRINIHTILLFCLSCLGGQQLRAQANLTATLDSTQMWIGHQSLLHLEVSGPDDLSVQWPEFPGDSLITGIEILRRGPVDTLEHSSGTIHMKRSYVVTSFDSGLYYIPPIYMATGTDSIASNSLALKIHTLEVDPNQAELFDIKPVVKPRFVLADYANYIALFFGVYALALLLIWLFLKRKYRVRKTDLLAEQIAQLPAHVWASFELDRLKADQLWREGMVKAYYTRLSDILRGYMERRYHINALEMTSSEILTLFARDRNMQSVYQNLKQILQLSDLVKFAKFVPLENEHELSLMNAYLFINQTKVEEVETKEEDTK